MTSQSGSSWGWSIGMPSGRIGHTAATQRSFINAFTSATAQPTSAPRTSTMLFSLAGESWQ